MIKTKTVFVVGAGASVDMGLPLGEELKRRIATATDIRFGRAGRREPGGDDDLFAAYEYLAARGDESVNDYLAASWSLGSSLPLAISIDNFLEAHSHDEILQRCGKLAIVRSILSAERDSWIFLNDRDPKPLAVPDSIDKAPWHVSLCQMLTEGVRRENISSLSKNVSFIVFNYDRCLEHFLARALQLYYRADEQEIFDVVNQIRFVHPYGKPGRLPWELDERYPPIAFGARPGAKQLVQLSDSIKIFSERLVEQEISESISELLLEAGRIVFLGFGYIEQNMRLLTLGQHIPADFRHIYGTTKGISEANTRAIELALRRILRVPDESREAITLVADSCAKLLRDYSMVLR
jgi:hypothetical protein